MRHASGLTSLSLRVSMSEAMVTQCSAPPSEPANSIFPVERDRADRGPLMHARIGMLRALNRHVERVFNPELKDPHWGRHKPVRDHL